MKKSREEYERAEAAGGLRRPPTKSPNRIPFGFRASPRTVNNVFTRRFGSFAVGRASPSSILFGAHLALHTAPSCVLIGTPSHFFFSSFASVRAPYAVGWRAARSADVSSSGLCMNIDNTAGQEETDDRSNVNISVRPYEPSPPARSVLRPRERAILRLFSFLGDPPFSPI